MPKIRFHIGAHKTATTHQQQVLGSSSFHPGTRFVPLSLLRRTLTSPVRRSRPHLPWHRWYNGVWLLSDENMLGTTADALAIYPEAAPALRHFLDCDLQVFLSVRRYDNFLASAYGERLWRHPFRPFPGSLPTRRWPDLVRDLQQQVPGVPIAVWQYEHYRQHQSDIMQFYAGQSIECLGKSRDSAPKSAFSTAAVNAMTTFSEIRPRRHQVERIRDRYPVDAQNPPFDPWTPAQRQQLHEWYNEDLLQLAGMVELWQPPAKQQSQTPN